jgi:hypothetical protein
LMLNSTDQSNYGLALATRMARSIGAQIDLASTQPGEVRVRFSVPMHRD